nr:SNAP25 homologous protein SNAP33-like [Ipomoea trifida]
MFGLNKFPLHRNTRNHSVDPGFHTHSSSNPFDSDDEYDKKQTVKASKSSSEPASKSSSEPTLVAPNLSTNPFDDDETKVGKSSSAYSFTSADRNRYKNGFHDSGGLESQSVQELENYAVYKAEETTKSVNGCLKIAEEIREDATKTLITLHHQSEQITRTHMTAADIDYDLSRGEKLLGSLGGLFSKTWKPKKNRPITGPIITKDDPVLRRGNHLEQREKLGLNSATKGQSNARRTLPEPTNALQKVEVEKAKQDDALSDLSNLLGELKEMAIDMGSEIDRSNSALDHLDNDIDELNYRVRGANMRGRRLLGK